MVLMVAAVAVAVVNAQYIEVDISSDSTCNTITNSLWYQAGTCVVTGSASQKQSISSSGYSGCVYTDKACSTGATCSAFTAGCNAVTTGLKYSTAASGTSFVQIDIYSDTSCTTLNVGPAFYPLNQCIINSATASAKVTQSGSSFNFCVYTDKVCSAGSSCQSATSGSCTQGIKLTGDANAIAPSFVVLAVAVVAAMFGVSSQ